MSAKKAPTKALHESMLLLDQARAHAMSKVCRGRGRTRAKTTNKEKLVISVIGTEKDHEGKASRNTTHRPARLSPNNNNRNNNNNSITIAKYINTRQCRPFLPPSLPHQFAPATVAHRVVAKNKNNKYCTLEKHVLGLTKEAQQCHTPCECRATCLCLYPPLSVNGRRRAAATNVSLHFGVRG